MHCGLHQTRVFKTEDLHITVAGKKPNLRFFSIFYVRNMPPLKLQEPTTIVIDGFPGAGKKRIAMRLGELLGGLPVQLDVPSRSGFEGSLLDYSTLPSVLMIHEMFMEAREKMSARMERWRRQKTKPIIIQIRDPSSTYRFTKAHIASITPWPIPNFFETQEPLGEFSAQSVQKLLENQCKDMVDRRWQLRHIELHNDGEEERHQLTRAIRCSIIPESEELAIHMLTRGERLSKKKHDRASKFMQQLRYEFTMWKTADDIAVICSGRQSPEDIAEDLAKCLRENYDL